jgi:hypothetical protein
MALNLALKISSNYSLFSLSLSSCLSRFSETDGEHNQNTFCYQGLAPSGIVCMS